MYTFSALCENRYFLQCWVHLDPTSGKNNRNGFAHKQDFASGIIVLTSFRSSRAKMIGIEATQILMPLSHLNRVHWANPFLCFKSFIKLQTGTILGQNILLQEVCKYDMFHLLQQVTFIFWEKWVGLSYFGTIVSSHSFLVLLVSHW